MKIRQIGNYTIFEIAQFKQIQSINGKLLQISNKNKFYVDTLSGKILKKIKLLAK